MICCHRDLLHDDAFVDEVRVSIRHAASVLLRRAQRVITHTHARTRTHTHTPPSSCVYRGYGVLLGYPYLVGCANHLMRLASRWDLHHGGHGNNMFVDPPNRGMIIGFVR